MEKEKQKMVASGRCIVKEFCHLFKWSVRVASWAEDLVLKLHNGEHIWVRTGPMATEGILLYNSTWLKLMLDYLQVGWPV